jgi:radical SAM superfamily enzyme YgiQ (UPF0313 family)
MNVLLISPLIQECNYAGDYYARWPQLGLTYIASTLEQKGHKVKILEKKLLSGPRYPSLKEDSERINQLILKNIEDFRPGLIGLTATTPVIMDAYRTARVIKLVYPNTPIIIGGRHVTSEPFYTLGQCPQIDIVCRGEGEITMLELAEGLSWDKIKGIIYRRGNGDFAENPDRPLVEDLDEFPYPAWHLLDEDFYFQPNIGVMRGNYMRTATIMTSRGCPYRCAFCQSPELLDIYGKSYIRYHSVDRVIGEIEYLRDKFKIRGISFNDDMFSLNKGRVLEICNKVIERGINKDIQFTVNLRSDRVDEEILYALKEAGCIHIIYGSESGSEATLKRMNKSLKVSENIEAIKLTKQYALVAEVNIVIGSPGETKEDFLQTIKFLKDSQPDKIFVSKFYPLPGTQFFRQLMDRKIMQKPQNWDEINDLYVENDDFTFADMEPKEFVVLRNRLIREVVALTNFLYVIKSNLIHNPILALSQVIKLFLYLPFLYLSQALQASLKKAVAKYSFNLRYLLRR